MNDEPQSKWPQILFFTIIGILFGISIYLIAGWAMRSEARAQVSATSPNNADTYRKAPHNGEPRVRIVLRRDVKTRLDKVDVIYRGIEDKRVKLDVFIRDLDPRYPYRREIAYRSAKQGFRLGGVRFELISAGRAKAKLVWIRKG
jgi:hypothetical protein